MRSIAILMIAGLLMPPTTVLAEGAPVDQAAYQRGFEIGRNQGASQGRIDGAKHGQVEGEKEGKRKGHQDGEAAGREKGWAEGAVQGEPVGRQEGDAKGISQGRAEGERDGRQKAYNDGHQLGHQQGYAEGYDAGVNSDAAEKGAANGASEASRVERARGLSEGRRDGYSERERQIRSGVMKEIEEARAGQAALAGGGIQNGAFELDNTGNPNALAARNAVDDANGDFNQGKKDGYKDGYDKAFEEGKQRTYEAAYDNSYFGARELAYNDSYERHYNAGYQDAWQNAYNRAYQDSYQREYYRYMAMDWKDDRDRGYQEGFSKGQDEGYKKGYDETYNAAYQKAYRDTAAQVYPEAFAQGQDAGRLEAQAFYDSHSVVELSEVVVSDENSDGMFAAGEKVFGKVTCINYGSVDSAALSFEVGTDNPDAPVHEAQGMGNIASRSQGSSDVKIAKLSADIGMNVPVHFAVTLKENGNTVGTQNLKILVLNPNSTRYKFLMYGASTIDRAVRLAKERGQNAPQALLTAKEYMKAATQVVRLDTNPETIKVAEKAKSYLDVVISDAVMATDPVEMKVGGLATAASNMIQNFLR